MVCIGFVPGAIFNLKRLFKISGLFHDERHHSRSGSRLSGPLDRLNAILSLLQPIDRFRAPSAIGSAIGRPLSRPISHPRTGRSPQPPRSKPLRGAQPRDSGAIVSQTSLKQARNENAIEAAILNRVLDRDGI